MRDGEPNAQGGIGLCAVFWIPLYDQSAPADEAEAFRRSG
ncbi:two component sensor kinase [Bordetella pertussis]|nr:two component sensor kinase [Bordetella pertussis]CFW38121.1 two component sensor kinase [Bordetella pertussis]